MLTNYSLMVAITHFKHSIMKSPESVKRDVSKRIEQALDSYLKNTPKKIRELRQGMIPSSIQVPMSKNDLALITDVGAQNVGKVEKDYGEPHSLNASIKYLIKLAIIFDIDMNFLVGLTEEPRRLSGLSNNTKKQEVLAEGKLDQLIDLQKQMLEALKS